MKREEKGYIFPVDAGRWQLGFIYQSEDDTRSYLEYDTYASWQEAFDDMVAVQRGLK